MPICFIFPFSVTMATSSSSNEDQPWDVIIIGAGLAGLTAAYRILKTDSNAKVLVLEAKGQLKKILYCQFNRL